MLTEGGTKMRKGRGAYYHWCPACLLMHGLPHEGWVFNGDVEGPTFTPSFRHRFTRQGGGDVVCHYIVTGGTIAFQDDCSHHMKGDTMPMPDVPQHAAEALGL